MREAVIDTNVVISWMLTPHGIPGQIMETMNRGAYDAALSNPTWAEYRDVLRRPKFHLDPWLVEKALVFIRQHGRFHIPIPQPERCGDPKDQPFWDLAVTADAALVTGNVRDFPNSPRVRTPREFHDELIAGA